VAIAIIRLRRPVAVAVINPNAVPIRIRRAVGTIRIAGPIGIVDALSRIGAAVTAIRIGGGFGIVGIGAQSTPVVAVFVIELWRIGRIRIVRRLVAVATAIFAIRVVDAVRVYFTEKKTEENL
jgi:hypothetical protein